MKPLIDEALASFRDASMAADDHEATIHVLACLGTVLVCVNRIDERLRALEARG